MLAALARAIPRGEDRFTLLNGHALSSEKVGEGRWLVLVYACRRKLRIFWPDLAKCGGGCQKAAKKFFVMVLCFSKKIGALSGRMAVRLK
jgi:hypothetical protein